MGRPKLLLPWDGETVIERVLGTWRASRATRVTVVVRPDDQALIEVCRRFEVDVVTPLEPPPEMKDSVRLGLEHIAARYAPTLNDYWLLAPADLPQLSTASIDLVISQLGARAPDAPVVPSCGGQRGHPVAFPWRLAPVVRDIPAGSGVNWLLRQERTVDCVVGADAITPDLDTWEEYRRALDATSPKRPDNPPQ